MLNPILDLLTESLGGELQPGISPLPALPNLTGAIYVAVKN